MTPQLAVNTASPDAEDISPRIYNIGMLRVALEDSWFQSPADNLLRELLKNPNETKALTNVANVITAVIGEGSVIGREQGKRLLKDYANEHKQEITDYFASRLKVTAPGCMSRRSMLFGGGSYVAAAAAPIIASLQGENGVPERLMATFSATLAALLVGVGHHWQCGCHLDWREVSVNINRELAKSINIVIPASQKSAGMSL